jgi:selenide,water dikinase
VMRQLNRAAAEAMQTVGARACTDVAGFGLLGHLREMAEQSQVAAKVHLGRVPVLPGTWEFLAEGAISHGTRQNHRFLHDRVRWHPTIAREARILLCDAQTSGGLLIAVAAERAEALAQALAAAGVVAADIGEILPGPAGLVEVVP